MRIQRSTGVIFAVIVVIVGLAMVPLALNQIGMYPDNEYTVNFPGPQALTLAIGLIATGLAGAMAGWATIKVGRPSRR